MQRRRKIAVAGATGRVGRHVVDVLEANGHDVVPMSRSSGVDVVTGEGLADALAGVACIIDVATQPSPDEEAATAFFSASARNLQESGARAGVERIVLVSIIGIDRFTTGYYAAKLAQERAMLSGPIPVRILRAAQFHEFVADLVEWGRQDDVSYVPSWRTQLVAARTVAEALVDLATVSGPARGSSGPPFPEIAGPREENLVDVAKLLTARRGDAVRIETAGDPDFPESHLYETGALLPGPKATLAGPTFEEWLDSTSINPRSRTGGPMNDDTRQAPTLVLGGTGKIGRRVVERLTARGLPVRVGLRSGEPPFDWDNRSTWDPVLEGVGSAYVAHYWDAIPGAAKTLGAFAELAVERGVSRLVLLSGRGEEEAERAGQAVRASGAELTILRSTWFAQNFSEDYWQEQIQAGELALPAGDTPEPFVDADDIAEVAVAALTDDRHIGELYELTGPRLLSFAEAVAEISRATGREIRYVPMSIEDFAAAAAEKGVPSEVVEMLSFLFAEVLDGRNARLADGVQRALGREPRDFSDYARDAAATGIWNARTTRAA